MKPIFLAICLLCVAIFATNNACYAAFPVQTEPAHTVTGAHHQTFSEKVQDAIKRYTSLSAPKKTAEKADNGTLGILSFTFGIAGLLALVVGAIASGGVVLLWPIFGIAAVVLGALGLKNKNNGLAIAGFVLGLVEVTLFLAAIVLAIAAISSFK